MIVEIGTSDFRTQAGLVDGLFIEPIKEYFDRLPNCNKENVAISDIAGELDIFYIPSDTIKKNNLPNWVRGCNSIHKIHPTIISSGWSEFVVCDHVKVERIKTVFDRNNIKHIDILKIDTEGHDCVILNDFLDTVEIKPNIIQFECNELSPVKDVQSVVKRLELIGYACGKVKFDMICKKIKAGDLL